MRRLVLPVGGLSPGRCRLPADVGHYVARVLRGAAGDDLLLLDGEGGSAVARITSIERDQVEVEVGPVEIRPFDGIALSVIQAIGKRDKMEMVVRQVSELGVRRIVPILTERTVAEKRSRLFRWNAIADDALRVSGGFHRTVIDPVTTMAEVLARPRAELSLVLAPGAAVSLRRQLRDPPPLKSAELLIGPEGGLTQEEIRAATAAGFAPVHLGQRTLRMETAGPAAVAIFLFATNHLGA